MPTTTVTGPDGQDIVVEHPAGASDADIIAYAVANATADEPPAKRPSEWSELPSNIIPSFVKMGEQLGQAVMNPLDTLSSMGKMVSGGIQSFPGGKQILEPLEMLGIVSPQDTQFSDAMAQDYKDAYGSFSKAKETIITDPARILGDVAMIGSGGSLLPGKFGQMAGKLASLDPISLAAKGTGKLASALNVGTPEQLYQGAVKIPPSVPIKQRREMIQTGLEEGIVPNPKGVDKINDIIRESGEELTALLEEAKFGGRISKDDVLKGARAYRDEFNPLTAGDDAGLIRRQIDTTIKNQEKAWENVNTLTPVVVLEFKRAMDKKIRHSTIAKEKGSTYKPGVEQTRMDLRSSASEAIENISPETSVLNKRMSKLIRLREGGLESASSRIGNQTMMNIPTTIAGVAMGGGVLAGGIPAISAILGTLGFSWLTNPLNKARAGILMDKLKKSPLKKTYIDPVNNALTRQGAIQLRRMMEQEGVVDPEEEKQGMLAL